MHLELEKCEKALTEYLDMKKNVFPRYDFAKASSEVQLQSDVVRGAALPCSMPDIGFADIVCSAASRGESGIVLVRS